MNYRKISLFLSLFLALTTVHAKKSKELDYASLELDYNNLVHNQKYVPYAKAEKIKAKKSVEALINNQVKRKLREQALYKAKNNIAYARLTAEAQWLKNEIAIEQKVASDYQISISKIEAQIARHDAEVARMMLIAQQEEAQRAKQRAQRAEQQMQNSINETELMKQRTEAAMRLVHAQADEAKFARQEAELANAEAALLRKKLNSIATEQTDKGLMMTLGDFVFDSGKSTIKKEAKANFSKVVEFINAYPNKKVRIEGHTDSSGSNELNLTLSQKRANAVKNILVKNGIKASQIEAVGMGEEFPIADNASRSGKAKNRRVEIIILQ